MPKTIMPIVLAGIIQNNNILLLKREKDPFKNLWSLPGGKIEPNEFLVDALNREIIEETNLSLISLNFFGVVSELVSEKNTIKDGHLINIFLIEKFEGDLKPSNEGQLRWFSYAEIENQKAAIIPSDYAIITKILYQNQPGIYNSLVIKKKGEYLLKNFQKVK